MKTRLHCLLIALAWIACVHEAAAQGTTAFTYQGQLRDGGTNANGTYTIMFKLYDAASGGSQKGGTLTNNPTLANGLFSVNLDFGPYVFDGNTRWLDITVQNGSAVENLTPRVQVLPTPYAIFANVASNLMGTVPSAQLGGVYSNAVTFNNTLNQIFGVFTGNGGSLANVNAAMLGGLSKNSFALLDDLTNYATLEDLAIAVSASTLHGITNFDASTNFDAPAIYTFTVPLGVTQLYIEAWGGGGGGGGMGLEFFSGGSGGTGGYARGYINVTQLQDYIIQVGNAGTSGTDGDWPEEDGTDGADGGDTLIKTIPDSKVLFKCTGGAGGTGGSYTLFEYGAGGAGGKAEHSAVIQRDGSLGNDGSNFAHPSGIGTFGTLQPALPPNFWPVYNSYSSSFDQVGYVAKTLTYGSGGIHFGSGTNSPATGGCVIIQW